jgi:uncharacterized protein (TIGR03083 family)
VVSGDDLGAATALVAGLLRSIADDDWATVVPDVGAPVGGLVTHIAACHLWYAIDLTAAGRELEPIQLSVESTHPPELLVATLETAAAVLCRVLAGAPAGERGFHPMGRADPSGFAAMACDETLVHGRDIAVALGVDVRPDDALAARVVARLFPWVDAGDEPWEALLWANGRTEWQGRARLDGGWRWHCAPLAEWDGEAPETTPGAER